MKQGKRFRRAARAGIAGSALASLTRGRQSNVRAACPTPPAGAAPELLEIGVGRELVSLFKNSSDQRNPLLAIPRLREQLAKEGVRMPKVRVRDWPALEASSFVVAVRGSVKLQGSRRAGAWNCPGEILAALRDVARKHFPVPCSEPGLPAV
ncbi:MAG: hypothetical protein RIC55_05045 [Pirellulaceae bacterium]